MSANDTNSKPQVLLRIPSNYLGETAVEIIKKWKDGTLSIEMQIGDGIKNHNTVMPVAFFPITQEEATKFIEEYKEKAA